MGRPKKNAIASSSQSVKKTVSLEGLTDIITQTDSLWNLLLRRLNRIWRVYGFSFLEIPFVEDWQLYENYYRNHKEQLSWLVPLDLGNKKAALRGSFLPSVFRAYWQNRIFDLNVISKWAFAGPVVYKAPDDKNLSSHYEFGFEVFGTFSHLTEAQLISGVWELLLSLGFEDLILEINNIGQESDQRVYQDTLLDYLSTKKYELCDTCNDHLSGRVLNVFRCRNLGCQAVLAEAPSILDFLDEISRKHFTNILEALDELGIPYQLNPLYVGLDGHSRTNFVIKYRKKGETVVIGEGGYHDGLMQNVCGKNFCCFGFLGNLTVVYNLLQASKAVVEQNQHSDVFLVPLGELAAKKSLRLFRDLTNEKIAVYDHFGLGGVKNQLKTAENFKAPVALIMGQKEALDEVVILRDVKSGMQEIISYDKIVEEVKKRLGK